MIGLYFGRSDGLKLYFVIASPKSPNSQLHIYVANMHLVEYCKRLNYNGDLIITILTHFRNALNLSTAKIKSYFGGSIFMLVSWYQNCLTHYFLTLTMLSECSAPRRCDNTHLMCYNTHLNKVCQHSPEVWYHSSPIQWCI